ncbi:MAG: HesA/MoeB/ThiF family protein [Tabrizicola sp.]|jgi:molybdopterin/thiamine biosynthesis adenylyltransferase|nr:HesA/MoeB/ThiF family protein [Tabrizicola sp.]
MIGLLGFAGLWALGRWRGWGERWLIAAAVWWAVLMVVHLPLLFPEPVLRFFGGDLEAWLVFGLLAAVAVGYRQVLRLLRRGKAAEPEAPVATDTFREAELDRYARHILLREIGGAGQKKLKGARVLVVGAGGLGSPVLLYLAGAGVGVIGVIDHDVVEGSNLQRQVIHTDARIGMPKVFSAEAAIRALNPFIEVRPYHRKLTEEIAVDLVRDYDLVLEGTDDFDTRYLVNQACVAAGVPLISGAITQWEGQVSLFHPAKGGPCYACVFPVKPAPGLVPTCAEAGVAAPLPGVVGSMMAMEAVKWVTGAGETLAGRLMIHDALYAETRVIGVKKRADCAVCGGEAGRVSTRGQILDPS